METLQLALTVLLIISTAANAISDPTDFSDAYIELEKKIQTDPHLQELWTEHVKQFMPATNQQSASTQNFACTVLGPSPNIPDSVHKLKPGDIKVIGAMGDSLTAANGAKAWTLIGCLFEYRGVSWSVGGEDSLAKGITTLPNILKTLNPNLYGYATGEGNYESSKAGLNVATPGKTSSDVPRQANYLIEKMKNDKNINMKTDWKMVTLFIGGNDLCDYCKEGRDHTPETYLARVEEALDILYANVPRLFVNVIPIFDITPVAEMSNSIFCDAIHDVVCKCAIQKDKKEFYVQLAASYRRVLKNLILSGKYDKKDDFTVVWQPFYDSMTPPRKDNGDYDLSYFSPDCFHFSKKGHGVAATALWNSLTTPVNLKKDSFQWTDKIECQSQYTYLATSKNQPIVQSLAVDSAKVEGSTVSKVSQYWSVFNVLGIIGGCLFVVLFTAGVVFYRSQRQGTSTTARMNTGNITEIGSKMSAVQDGVSNPSFGSDII